jgi:hypothetical protein
MRINLADGSRWRTGVGDRCSKFGAGSNVHAGKHDRVVNAEQARQRRREDRFRRRHVVVIRRSVAVVVRRTSRVAIVSSELRLRENAGSGGNRIAGCRSCACLDVIHWISCAIKAGTIFRLSAINICS